MDDVFFSKIFRSKQKMSSSMLYFLFCFFILERKKRKEKKNSQRLSLIYRVRQLYEYTSLERHVTQLLKSCLFFFCCFSPRGRKFDSDAEETTVALTANYADSQTADFSNVPGSFVFKMRKEPPGL